MTDSQPTTGNPAAERPATHHERFGCDVCFGFDPPRNPYWRDNVTKTCDPCEARIKDRMEAFAESRAFHHERRATVKRFHDAYQWRDGGDHVNSPTIDGCGACRPFLDATASEEEARHG